MALDLARLGLEVDSSQVRRASSDLERFSRDGKKAAGAAESVGKSWRSMASGLLAARKEIAAIAASITSVVAGGIGLSSFVRASQEITQITNGFRSMGQSADQAASTLDAVAEIARKTRAPLGATAELYKRVSIAGRDLGATQESLKKFTESVGFALGASGISASQASGALLQLSQAMAGGVVRAEEFNSILEGAFPIAQAAANGIDKAAGSVGRLRDMVIKGEVSSREFFEAIISQSAALESAFASTEQTIGQAVTAFGDSFALLANETDRAFGVSSGIASAIQFLADNLEVIRNGILGAASVVTAIYLPAITSAVAATGAWVASLVTLKGALLATGIGALIVGAGTLIGFMLDLRKATGSWGEALDALGDLAAGVWEGIKTSASSIRPALGAIWKGVQSDFFALMENLSAKWRDFLIQIAGQASSLPIGGETISGELFEAAGRADAAVTSFMRSANDAEVAAAALRNEAASLATEGFEKAKDAVDKLTAIMNKEVVASTEAEDRARGLASRLKEIGDSGGAAAKAAEGLSAVENAAQEAARAIADTNRDLAKSIVDPIKEAFKSAESATDAFSKAALGILTNLRDRLLDQVFKPIEDALFKAFSGGGGGGVFGSIGSAIAGIFGGGRVVASANGNVFNNGNVVPFARGGIVSGPTVFPMRNGAGLMGEAGPEAIMPLTRVGGKLGVRASGGGGQVVNNITINAPPGSQVEERSQQNSTGGEDIFITIDRVVSGLARNPGSQLSKTLQTGFGLNPATRSR